MAGGKAISAIKKCVHCALFISVFCFTQSLHTGTFPKKVLVQYLSGDRVNLWAAGELKTSHWAELPVPAAQMFVVVGSPWMWNLPVLLSLTLCGITKSFSHLCPLFWFLPFLCFKRERHWSWAQDPMCCQHPAPAPPTSTQWTHKRGSLELINLYLTHLRHNHQLFKKKYRSNWKQSFLFQHTGNGKCTRDSFQEQGQTVHASLLCSLLMFGHF